MISVCPDDVLAESEQIRRERILLLEARSGDYFAAKGRLLGEDPQPHPYACIYCEGTAGADCLDCRGAA